MGGSTAICSLSSIFHALAAGSPTLTPLYAVKAKGLARADSACSHARTHAQNRVEQQRSAVGLS